MTTALDIVTRASRKIGVTAHDEEMTSDVAASGLDALNMMLAAWKLAGVDISHTALTLSSTFPLAAEYEEGTVYMLASRIAPDYARPANFDADDFFRKIQAAYYAAQEATVDDGIAWASSYYRLRR